jgi:hypothetical protein
MHTIEERVPIGPMIIYADGWQFALGRISPQKDFRLSPLP